MWPDANIAVATGEKSGFIVVDVDPEKGGFASMRALISTYGQLIEKVYQNTGGGGWHILFKHPGIRIGNVQNSQKLGAGVDVRGDGGYIVITPSLHQSGKRYSWGTEHNELPDAPTWLLEILRSPESHTGYSAIGDIPEGQRNNTLASLAGVMRRRGMSETAILAALKAENLARCAPPLDDLSVERTARSIARYTPEAPISAASAPDYMEGVYSVGDLSDAIDALYETGWTAGASTGWQNLDEFYTVKRGQWTVLTGIPSHGKTAVLDALMVNLAIANGWKFCVCSPENQPLARHAASLMSLWAGEPFSKGSTERMSSKTKDEAKVWLDEHFVFVLPLEHQCSVEGILDLISLVRGQRAVDGVVIDPWNELEHKRPDGMSETEYVGQSLSFMRRFARAQELHLWLVVHPTKLQKEPKTLNYPVPTLYDCHGSAHFRNKADCGLVVWRDLGDEHSPTEIHVQKIRFRECGKIGKAELWYDKVTGRYSEEKNSYRHWSVAQDYDEERIA